MRVKLRGKSSNIYVSPDHVSAITLAEPSEDVVMLLVGGQTLICSGYTTDEIQAQLLAEAEKTP